MDVYVVGPTDQVPPEAKRALVLHEDNWNDWWIYKTQYQVYFIEEDRSERRLGSVKIGQTGMDGSPSTGGIRPDLPRKSKGFDANTFSVGQDSDYYENVAELGAGVRDSIHMALKDIAYDLSACDQHIDEHVMVNSLLRDVPVRTIRGQFARQAHGGVKLTPFSFSFLSSRGDGDSDLRLDFAVTPGSTPPTNIHAIIGRNGVGKSTQLNLMAKSLAGDDSTASTGFAVEEDDEYSGFNNLVLVSFSAFDEFQPVQTTDNRAFRYAYIGLKDQASGSPDHSQIVTEAVTNCLSGPRKERLVNAISLLDSDPIFAQTELAEVIDSDLPAKDVSTRVSQIYSRLSSGHKIVFSSLTRLVATVDEKTLVLIDEPEAHLHPPLLSAYIRALSNLLINRNGVAIVATHSPVVLQETPASCVYRLSRVGNALAADRPERETFGENVGTLTNDVFGLEVAATGFHKMLTDVALEEGSYSTTMARFKDQVGAEGRAILRSRIARQQQNVQ